MDILIDRCIMISVRFSQCQIKSSGTATMKIQCDLVYLDLIEQRIEDENYHFLPQTFRSKC